MKRRYARGFTLVEMAIVLVIIGIILAGVMKGRDIVRGAQVKQFSQQFAQKWATIAQTYYDKTGQQINDGTVNGGNSAVNSGLPDGFMDGGAGLRAYVDATTGIIPTLNAVGIEPCTMVKSKLVAPAATTIATYTSVSDDHCGATAPVNVFQTLVEGEYAGSTVVTVDLVGRAFTIGTETYRRNAVVLYRVPIDVAVGLDTAIDGKEDGESGSCVNMSNQNAATPLGYTAATNSVFFNPIPAAAGAVIAKAWPDASDATVQLTTVGILLDY